MLKRELRTPPWSQKRKEVSEIIFGKRSIFLLPGLGATSDLFADYQFPFPTRTVEYSAPARTSMGLPDYSVQLIAENGIQPGDSLIGVSLGGMISCEIARQMPLSKLTLVSSCTNSGHIQPLLRKLRPVNQFIPWQMFQKLPFPPFILSRTRRRALAMFRVADAMFIRWACQNAATWKCPPLHPDIVQIHGDKDPVFPISRQKIDHIIRGGDHLMILSHRLKIQPLLIARHHPAP